MIPLEGHKCALKVVCFDALEMRRCALNFATAKPTPISCNGNLPGWEPKRVQLASEEVADRSSCLLSSWKCEG